MDKLKLFPNERVGLPDAEAGMGGQLVLDDSIRRGVTMWLPSGRSTTGQAATSARIFSGFNFSGTPVGNATATLVRGAGIFPFLDGSVLKFGLLQGDEGPASIILDFSAAANATYAVYVRALFNPGTFQNRVFWNPSGAPAREFVDSIPTRDVSTWQALFQDNAASAPGSGEWVRIADITVVANLITVVTEFRHFFYEGSAHTTDNYEQEWGDGANDRVANRTLSPVTDSHRFAQLIRRQLTDILGAASGNWGSTVPRHLTDLAIEHKAGGTHGDINADSITTVKASIVPTSADVGLDLDANAAPLPLMGSGVNLGSITDPNGGLPLMIEPYGRIAKAHRFFDDFMYDGWVSTATIPDKHYTATITNPSTNADLRNGVLATDVDLAIHGGAAVFETGANGGDIVRLRGPDSWLLDTDLVLYRFFARVAINGGIATHLIEIGMSTAAGGTYDLVFEMDNVANPNSNWHLKAFNGVTTARQDLGVAPTVNSMDNLYFAVTGDTTVIAWVSGMAAPLTLALPGALDMSALKQHQSPFAVLSNNGTATAQEMYLDTWEIWDQTALSQAGGAQGV